MRGSPKVLSLIPFVRICNPRQTLEIRFEIAPSYRKFEVWPIFEIIYPEIPKFSADE